MLRTPAPLIGALGITVGSPMTTKRDYGSLSKAAPRFLTPLVEPLGYRQTTGACYARPRSHWTEGFFLQASAHGSGDFCVNIGISVPMLANLWGDEGDDANLGLVIAERLTPEGIGADYWYSAQDKSQLVSSAELMVRGLVKADRWFARVNSMTDIAKLYTRKNVVSKKDDRTHLHVLSNTNYGFLLLLAGEDTLAREWLSIALRQFEAIVAENEARFSRRKPGKKALAFHAIDVQKMKAVRAVLCRDA